MADLALLTVGALAVFGQKKMKSNIYRILTYAGNSGSIDQITGKKDTASIGNVDPNLCGNGAFQAAITSQRPLPPGNMANPLDPVIATHPGQASPFITNFGSSSLIGY